MQTEFEYINEIYRAGSFSKAADNLHITQPALSMSVKKIEAAIGMALFDRSTRPLQLTEAGRIFIATIERMTALEEDMNSRIQDIHELRAGNLCIGGSHYINAYILPEVMTRFSSRYPGIKLELIEASSAELTKMLSERMIDLTFSCNDEIIANFEHYPVFHDHILLAVSPDMLSITGALTAHDILSGLHLEAEYPAITPEAMASLEFVILSDGNNLHDRAHEIFRAYGITPRIKLEISQLATSYYLARSGFGATFISDRMITPEEKRLNFYRIDSPITDRIFYAVLPKRNYTSKAVRAFIELCKYLHKL